MKNIQLYLNIFFVLALAALATLHFTGMGTGKSKPGSTDIAGLMPDANGIFFVHIDSVINNFDMATDLTGELESKLQTSEATFQAKQNAYQKELNDYQYKVQRGLVTRSEAQDIEQQLYGKQQELMKLQQDLSLEINEKQAVMNRQVINAIMDYLKENSSNFNYKYVLGSTFGGNILFANDSLDITQSIITGLNNRYKESRKQE